LWQLIINNQCNNIYLDKPCQTDGKWDKSEEVKFTVKCQMSESYKHKMNCDN